MQPYLLSILSGLMMTVSFPNTDWNCLAWICLIPFFTAIEGRGWKETLRIGYAGGVAFYWSLFYWLNNVTVAGFFVGKMAREPKVKNGSSLQQRL